MSRRKKGRETEGERKGERPKFERDRKIGAGER